MQKDAAEMRLHGALLQFWRGQLERIKKRILPGVPRARRASPADRLDKAFWDGEDRELLAVLMPILTDMAEEGGQIYAEWIEEQYGIGVDWSLITASAIEWAKVYSYRLVKGLNSTTVEQLRSRIATWIETPGANLGELYSTLERLPAFNAHRARLVGVTETTRIYRMGNLQAVRQYETEGLLEWRRIWRTNNDDIVCFLCSPLNGRSVRGLDAEYPEGGGDGPPRHPGCRCWEVYEPIF